MVSSSPSSSSSSAIASLYAPFFFFFFFFFISSSSSIASVSAADLSSVFYTKSAPDHVEFVDGGQEIHLILDQKNASGFESYNPYLFGYFNMRIKLPGGNSAGTVTTYYFSSLGEEHDELDFEFLGNLSGEPITLQTNVYAHGVGGREQRINLWFDPTSDFHNYTLLWNPYQAVFFVDGIPIRVFPNVEAKTQVPYLHNQSMYVYATIWDGDSWATQGGRIKLNWTYAPFVASYREFGADACSGGEASALDCASSRWWNRVQYRALNDAQLGQLKWVQENLTIYDYCTDHARYNVTPPECFYSTPSSLGASSPESSPPPATVSAATASSSSSSSSSDRSPATATAPSGSSPTSAARPLLKPINDLFVLALFFFCFCFFPSSSLSVLA